MSNASLEAVRSKLEELQLATTLIPDSLGGRLVCAQRSSSAGLHGNSVWIAYRHGMWYVSTWLPVVYRANGPNEIVAFCAEYVPCSVSPLTSLPIHIVAKYHFVEIDEGDFPDADDIE